MSVTALYENIVNLVTTLANYILALFPKSPFKTYIDNFDSGINLGWLAWFFPVKEALSIISVWLTAVSLYYLVSIVARWVKIIGD